MSTKLLIMAFLNSQQRLIEISNVFILNIGITRQLEEYAFK